jgi:hypothetical protein
MEQIKYNRKIESFGKRIRPYLRDINYHEENMQNDGSHHSEGLIESKSKLRKLLKRSYFSVAIDWCTPEYIREENNRCPGPTDGFGDGDWYMRKMIWAGSGYGRGIQHFNWRESVESVDGEIRNKRYVLNELFEIGKTNSKKRKHLLEKSDQIKKFLREFYVK